ncbi:SCO family protein [Ottowia sp.]|uniref:SCO family protein n=1 Tax=Ottowia sp. TaxID=1898956 RepID=UPI002BAA9B54|nr:SCO family protein [Ottowia sp.]HOB67322.1 SCO family protein [Ottowia sp.]HPZ55952.1 SCO family protein [Ottowia sp.]HQD48121.1 SCO family protein [Ottowia sp.]
MTLSRRFALELIAGGAFLTSAGGLLTACQPDKPQFRAIDITGADYAQGFQLTDFDGKPRSLADFKGKVVVVFFGYTQCPDVCPTTMGEMAQVKKLLGPEGDKLQVLFISIDPERDTPEVLKAYMASFDPGFLGLYAASPEALAALSKDYKVYYKKVDGKTPTSYTMDHTAASYVYDPQGRLRLYSRYGSGAEAMADDVRLLLKGV